MGSLENLVIANTKVDITTLTCPSHITNTPLHFVLNKCQVDPKSVPSETGRHKNLKALNMTGNNFRRIPKALSCLQKLDTLWLDLSNVIFPPAELLSKSAQDTISYLAVLQEEPVVNNRAKIIVVGQKGAGKSTLIKGMEKKYWFGKNDPLPRSDSVEISSLPFKKILCKMYDLAENVEYLRTHSLFLSSDCLHFVIVDFSRFVVSKKTRSADQFSRLELWLQTIASQGRKVYVNIVGTTCRSSFSLPRSIYQNWKTCVANFGKVSFCS